MVRQRRHFPPIAWVLLVSVIVTLPAIITRSITYDETISLLEVSAAPPNTDVAVRSSPVLASRLKEMFSGHRGFVSITQLIRELDIHPPIYYWTLRAWRQAFGSSIQVARLLSLTALLATIVAFYYLVRAVGFSRPTLAALIYALSSSVTHYGHEARGYSLGAFLVVLGALAAYRTSQSMSHGGTRRSTALFGLLTILTLSCAFLTHYLTVLSIATVLIWAGIMIWPGSRRAAFLLVGLTISLTVLAYAGLGLYQQFGKRAHQSAGFPGWRAEAGNLLRSVTSMYCFTRAEWLSVLGMILMLLLGSLAILSLVLLWTRRESAGISAAALFLGLAAAPAITVVLLDVVQQKHFSAWPKYLTYSSIGIAFLFAHATTHTPRVLRRVAAVLVACLLAVQLTGVNWGETRCNVRPREFSYREVARMVKESSEGASLVMVSVGWGRGDPWSYVYELDPDTEVVFFHWSTVTAELGRLASGYDEVWFLRASDRSISKREEKAWGEVLQASGHREVMSLAKGLILKAN